MEACESMIDSLFFLGRINVMDQLPSRYLSSTCLQSSICNSGTLSISFKLSVSQQLINRVANAP